MILSLYGSSSSRNVEIIIDSNLPLQIDLYRFCHFNSIDSVNTFLSKNSNTIEITIGSIANKLYCESIFSFWSWPKTNTNIIPKADIIQCKLEIPNEIRRWKMLIFSLYLSETLFIKLSVIWLIFISFAFLCLFKSSIVLSFASDWRVANSSNEVATTSSLMLSI